MMSHTDNEAAKYVDVNDIHPWPGNPRQNADSVREVARSIRRFGFATPIVARLENGEIIAGHTRYAAAKRLRLKTVPVRFLDISEAEAHALALADNKLGEIAAWDNDKLGEVLATLQADDVDLELGMGFSDREIEALIESDPPQTTPTTRADDPDRDFTPGSAEDQGRLDIKLRDVVCPKCRTKFKG